jgi:hypothetical protein
MTLGARSKSYSAEDVEQAVNAVKVDGLSLCTGSEQFYVPKSTIKDHLTDGHGSSIERRTVLSQEEEDHLA